MNVMKKHLLLIILTISAGHLFAQYDINQLYTRLQKGEGREVTTELAPLLRDSLFQDSELLMLLGDAYKSQFDHKKALEIYRRVLKIDSANMRAMESASDMYSALGESGSARRLLESLSALDSANIRIMIKLAQTCQSMQDNRAAVNLYRRIMKKGESGYNTVKSLADCYWVMGVRDSAEVYYKVADFINGKSLVTKLNLSQIAYIKKDMSSAKIYASRGSDLDSTYLPLRKQLGMVEFRLDEYKSAVKHFDYLLSKGDSTALKFAGSCNFFLGEFNKSIPLLRAALKRDSTDTETLFYLGSSLSHNGEPEEAIEIFGQILKMIQPDSSLVYKLHNQLGMAYSDMNKLQESYENFSIAYKLNPSDSKLLFQMAMVRGGFKDKASLQEAKSLLERYIESLMPKGTLLTAEEIVLRERAKMYIERIKEELFMNE